MIILMRICCKWMFDTQVLLKMIKLYIKIHIEYGVKLGNNDQNARHITFGLCVLENSQIQINYSIKDIHLEVLKFQNDLRACKVFIKTLNVGNKIACVRLVVSSELGLTPGCDIDAPRIYLLGIYLDIHVHARGIELPPAVEAQAKYGNLYLEPVHNEIQLHFLDKTV
ncbi:MAG: hypothetical protein EZS28_014535 [Streblomastix strix]|uniref:Uncharacterized protein n=1 Tax=Streblomastix strix TaxID=222440 RepID=A0A5J4W4K9_9EUKA|nr:MAG: hypothetical protein EZS28_014535 [Streblomastix strix]